MINGENMGKLNDKRREYMGKLNDKWREYGYAE